MKKLIVLLLSVIVLVLPFTACKKNTSQDTVYFKYFEDASGASAAFMAKTHDFALLAEPAASAALAKTQDTKVVFNLQDLYSQDGFPQAVMVVRNSIVENYKGFLNSFIGQMKDNEEWIFENTAQAVEGIANMGTTTLKAAALTQSALTNSNIMVKDATELKSVINSYIADIISVDSKSAKTLSDNFFAQIQSGQTNTAVEKIDIKVAAPDGAPALALAKLFYQNNQFAEHVNSVEYKVVAANQIGAQIAAGADIIIMPINAASNLLGDGSKYKLVTVNTHGNLYIVGPQSFNGTLSDLKNQTVISFGVGLVPDITLKAILNKQQIKFAQAN